jgi:hypothetical protein
MDWPKYRVYLVHFSENVTRGICTKIDRNFSNLQIQRNFGKVTAHSRPRFLRRHSKVAQHHSSTKSWVSAERYLRVRNKNRPRRESSLWEA